jgi:hypothetical protein
VLPTELFHDGRESTSAQRRTQMSFKDSTERAARLRRDRVRGVAGSLRPSGHGVPGTRGKLGSQLCRGVPDSAWMLQDLRSPSFGTALTEARNPESAAFATVVAWREDGSVRAAPGFLKAGCRASGAACVHSRAGALK